MASLFSLPVDLQIHVVQTWLGGNDDNLLKALSLLDVACTSKSLRQQFQDLASLPCLGWSIGAETSGKYYKHWLSARQVALRYLSLASIPLQDASLAGLSLPYVESLRIISIKSSRDFTGATLPSLQGLLTACPSLSSFLCYDMGNNKMWNTLQHCAQSAILQKLKRLEFIFHYGMETDMEVVCQVLAVLGPSLEVLRTSGFPLSDLFVATLATYCAGLKVLEIGDAEAPNVLLLLAECKELTELSVQFEDASDDTHQVLNAVAAANGKLKKFFLHYHSDHDNINDGDRVFFALFIEVLERYPWLESVAIGSSAYSPGSLTLRETDWSMESLGRLLKCARVPPTTALHLNLSTTHTKTLELLFSSVGANLTELSISCSCPAMASHRLKGSQVIAMFTHCRSLRTLALNDTIPKKWDPLLELCPGLRHLAVIGGYGTDHPHLTDSIVEGILSGCPELKTARFNCITGSISSEVLRFIAGQETKLCLEKLVLRHSGIRQDRVDQFRQQIKQQQWLPVLDLTTWQ